MNTIETNLPLKSDMSDHLAEYSDNEFGGLSTYGGYLPELLSRDSIGPGCDNRLLNSVSEMTFNNVDILKTSSEVIFLRDDGSAMRLGIGGGKADVSRLKSKPDFDSVFLLSNSYLANTFGTALMGDRFSYPIIGAGAVAPAVTMSESSFILNDAVRYGVSAIFDDGVNSSHTSGPPPHWYIVNFQEPYVITSYKLWGYNSLEYPDQPTHYELQGSNDGSTWTAVDTQVNNPPPLTNGFTWVSGGLSIPHLDISVANPRAFTSYRFYCTAAINRGTVRVRELQLIGYSIPFTFEVTGAAPAAYSDGNGNLVLPPISGVEYVLSIDLGTLSASYEIHSDSGFSSLVTSGSLANSTTSVEVGLVGPFFVRYRLASSNGIFSTWFSDPGAPFMNPEPIIGAGASVATVLNFDGTDPDTTFGPTVNIFTGDFQIYHSVNKAPPYIVQFELDSLYVVTRYKIWARGNPDFPDAPIDYVFQGSVDGVSWSDLDNRVNSPPPYFLLADGNTLVTDAYGHADNVVASPGPYNHYRLYITKTGGPQRENLLNVIAELQLIGYDPFPSVAPIIGAGAVAPSGFVLSASSTRVTASLEGAVDNNVVHSGDIWQSNTGPPQWFQIQLPTSYVVTSYKIWSRNAASPVAAGSYPDAPIDYILKGSNDGVNFIDVDPRVNEPPPTHTLSGFPADIPHITNFVATPGAYTHYRLHVTRSGGGSRFDDVVVLGELQLIGFAS